MARVLLHACCAPCSAAILEWMMANGVQPYIYYCNPNITPQEEYEHRRDELKRYAERLGVPFEEAPYDHEAWLEAVRGLEGEPERGKRCLACFRYRLRHRDIHHIAGLIAMEIAGADHRGRQRGRRRSEQGGRARHF